MPAKLGIKAGSVAAPDQRAGPTRPEAALAASVGAPSNRGRAYDVTLTFCLDRGALRARFGRIAPALATAGALWVCWPKKASGIRTDLTDHPVRADGLTAGLVDVKVAAIDATWSGLKFVNRPARGR